MGALLYFFFLSICQFQINPVNIQYFLFLNIGIICRIIRKFVRCFCLAEQAVYLGNETGDFFFSLCTALFVCRFLRRLLGCFFLLVRFFFCCICSCLTGCPSRRCSSGWCTACFFGTRAGTWYQIYFFCASCGLFICTTCLICICFICITFTIVSIFIVGIIINILLKKKPSKI